jgi:hypothetical protein
MTFKCCSVGGCMERVRVNGVGMSEDALSGVDEAADKLAVYGCSAKLITDKLGACRAGNFYRC